MQPGNGNIEVSEGPRVAPVEPRTERLDSSWILQAFKQGISVDPSLSTRYGVFLDGEMLARSSLQSFSGARVRLAAPEDLDPDRTRP